ncbi:polyketide synthase module [Paenibacillus popilliae ATCC 14706]|uniref:Polyketide synthase module n=1 Tax=Paenibacillus popilliae ATCC 14706 TaxID=1212764 RepID=M9LAD4_PAEPP|nr:polyketide synthase module [Paenibacillus popilliae ATCC 14706]
MFKRFCEAAQKPIVQDSNDYGIRKEPTIWKVSLGGSKENPIKGIASTTIEFELEGILMVRL